MDHRPAPEFLGTRLRHLLDLLDSGVARVYTDLGLPGFRPRYTPVIRLVHTGGPQSIRDLANTIGVTHSAVSQTVNQMRRDGLVDLRPGDDARQRIVHLTDHARAILPTLDAEWQATTAAARTLDAELPHPLTDLVAAALEALGERPMHDRIHDHLQPDRTPLPTQPPTQPGQPSPDQPPGQPQPGQP
ncbi:DNA-binding MarR family transcriptional regulator [Saccharothrix ecbatanensis]|uniref:DNA-binding MarR family transcriptional regulator n=1 Tax=Saccharothrix ecbatanensis TaxID=1105145 RepID=A0A7W9HIG3_9PSEU|nr:MarR family transcriptional regulator [Saccharothrix ecbatanensis]MBB5802508.1 DNA-binding MarR family transcriptional regulator [Saccharothrix ecbatanensis]